MNCQDCSAELIDEHYEVDGRKICFECARIGPPSRHYRGVHKRYGKKYDRSPPADKPLGEPSNSKKFEDTFSAEEVIMSTFFPGAETKAQ